ncbi:MAG: gamma-glutamyl-gamma-aminobutyrate hydrolase family protein [Bdellovibrionales bacterium]|nr:gamma-glutamyl-gamma-aminobutyrate hydrolase family protein [Bdellovibrionales bacterium]
MLKLGLSANFFHPNPDRTLYKNKRILFAEENMLHFFLSQNCLPIMIPTNPSPEKNAELLQEIDALLITGGADLSPESYGEKALKEEWQGDAFRDQYEFDLIKKALEADKPIMGICRGIQVLNVFFGGTLYQDIETMNHSAHKHRCWQRYEEWFHKVSLQKEGCLFQALGTSILEVNSVHHQAIKDLGKNLSIEAISTEDNIIEAIQLDPKNTDYPGRFVLGLQWHPEFFKDPTLYEQQSKIIGIFLDQAKNRKTKS